MSRKDNSELIGKIFPSNKYGDFQIIGYSNFNDVTIKFLDSGFVRKATLNAIKKGHLKDTSKPTVYGVGYLSEDSKTRDENGKVLKEYSIWKRMLERCYDSKSQRNRSSYIGCEVSENFKSFEYFSNWCRNQIGFNKDFELDKDLLVSNNKIYSEENCVFLPKLINSSIAKRGNKKYGEMGVRVRENSKKFKAEIRCSSIDRHLGVFDSREQAFLAYKSARENYVKKLAEEWRSEIDPRAYNALMNFEV